MGTYQYFSHSFTEARDKFTAACTLANIKPQRYIHPKKGPGGEELSVEAVWFGPRDAGKVLIISSGIHGTEGLGGAGCQTGWIAEGQYASLPEDVAVLMIHLINCHGVAYVEYQTDGFVDLNQNFRDFSQPVPANPAYDDIHEAFCCPELSGPKRDEADAFLSEYRAKMGEAAYWDAIWLGQDKHPDGFTYTGTGPTWSHRTMVEILEGYATQARDVCLIDIHSPMGPYGYACMWCMDPGVKGKALERAQQWFGAPLNTNMSCIGYSEYESDHDMPMSKGFLHNGVIRTLPNADVTPIGVEFGTSINQEKGMRVLQANRWLRFHGDPNSEITRQIQSESLNMFYPCTPDWTDMIKPAWDRIVTQAIKGLAGHGGF